MPWNGTYTVLLYNNLSPPTISDHGLTELNAIFVYLAQRKKAGIFLLGLNSLEREPYEQGETGRQLKQIYLRIGGDIHEK